MLADKRVGFRVTLTPINLPYNKDIDKAIMIRSPTRVGYSGFRLRFRWQYAAPASAGVQVRKHKTYLTHKANLHSLGFRALGLGCNTKAKLTPFFCYWA